MVGDIIRNSENQFDRIFNGTTVNPCEHCELAVNCIKSRSGCGHMLPVEGTEQFAECYIPDRIAYFECGTQGIADGIGNAYRFNPIKSKYNFKDQFINDDFYEFNDGGWEPVQPVFISAQTGSGKNYFIENTLIPYVKELNYQNKTNFKILIISNRIALKKQIEEHLKRNETGDDDDFKIYSYAENVNVITYQGLLRQRYRLKEQQEGETNGEKYLYVICDEAHFFTSDAMFNADTQEILSAIVETFSNAIRVYMSATPYECLSKIYESEEKTYKGDNDSYNYCQLAFYHFNRDYSPTKIFTYSNNDELLETITESVSKKKKRWLIFIDNKKECGELKNKLNAVLLSDSIAELNGKNPRVYKVSAEKRFEEKLIKIVKNEKLDSNTYVLISTSVLDNGINLNNIDNIVVSDTNPVKCIQMLGRARVQNDKMKTLYLKRFDQKYINQKISNIDVQMEAYHEFDLAFETGSEIKHQAAAEKFFNKYYWGNTEDWENAKHWFGHKYGKFDLYFNSIAKSLAEKRIIFYRFVQKKMDNEAEHNLKIGQWLLEYQLSWLGKDYCEDDDLTFMVKDKAKKQLISFLESCADSKTKFKKYNDTAEDDENIIDLEPDDQMYFRQAFTKLHDSAFGRKDPNKNRIYHAKKINELLISSNLPFKVDDKNKLGWIVVKTGLDNKKK